MNTALALALQITVIGMGLVFASIVLLWGLMAALVRLTAERAPVEPAAGSAAAEPESRERRWRAAAAAVAVALSQSARSRPALSHIPLPPTAAVSPWQAAMRANRLKQRGPVR